MNSRAQDPLLAKIAFIWPANGRIFDQRRGKLNLFESLKSFALRKYWIYHFNDLALGFAAFILSFTPWQISKVKFTPQIFFTFSLLQIPIVIDKM